MCNSYMNLVRNIHSWLSELIGLILQTVASKESSSRSGSGTFRELESKYRTMVSFQFLYATLYIIYLLGYLFASVDSLLNILFSSS